MTSIEKLEQEIVDILEKNDIKRLKKFPDVTIKNNYAIRRSAEIGNC